MRAPRYGLATTLALATWMSIGAAQASEPGPDTLPIHIISIQTMDADDQAEALTKALRNAVRATPGWSQGEGDYSLEVLTLSLKCPDPPDAGCQSRIADQIRADRYVWGKLDKGKGGNVTGELHFWVRGKGTTDHKVEYSANLTESQDEALRKIATDALNKLTDGPPKGEVKVKAGAVAGQVFVDGQPLGALTNGEGTFFVPSGKHNLVVKAPGYADMSTEVTVKPNSPTDVVVAPVPAGDTSPTNWKRIGGFAAIGAGVAFGAVGIYGTVTVNGVNKNPDYDQNQALYDQQTNICDLARGSEPVVPGFNKVRVGELCSTGETGQLLQLVFYPLAAIAAGAGVFLVATSGTASKEKPTTGFMVLPRVDRTGGKLDVGFRF
ncbi:PEGA domain-containing protein [Polyangium jinanense]|uniref:PEGA domain-containing protein n=1 Tax=Polyangium jinanense TaxID=2829994 RepID=A0A9X3X0K0_9BACT|nr:PEGA domain-containing protein [Polyangium jinanense]MDC3952721.1 PEGA domain-containing protein [Polyangium jinanense]MDC3980340.1 PEGA domain-containing protein [Polyangium jinanense]